MPEHAGDLHGECDRLARRLERERAARAQAETIAERAIRDLSLSNRGYENFFKLSLELLCTIGRDLHLRELNPAWEAALGWTLDELRARSLVDFIHPDDRERGLGAAGELFGGTQDIVKYENRLQRKDGGWVWLSWTARLADGICYAVAIDITKRVVVQQALRDSEARTRAILDSALDAVITIDEAGVIEDLNPAATKLFGYEAQELLGRNVSGLMPSPHREQHDRYLRNYLETGHAKVIGTGREVVALRKDGSKFPAHLSLGEVKGGGKRRFAGIIRDITEQQAAQARLEDSLLDLRKSRDDLLATLNRLRVGTMLIDADGRIGFLSEQGLTDCWPQASAVVGMHWEEVLPLDTPARNSLREAMRSGEAVRERVRLSFRTKRNQQCWAEVEVKDDPRDQSARIAFFYDVSELHQLRAEATTSRLGEMIGKSAVMRGVFERIAEVAKGDWTVLIEGETGAGKELVARAIHVASKRSGGPFIAVNCAGLSESLLQSQLFGHRKGAFTGAVADQRGFFEAASGGTILLDEIGDISPSLQSALLRVIQEREVMRIGDSTSLKVDVRILVATHRDLGEEVAAGRFRQDLLYRIRVARVTVPPLRERREDIPLLAEVFLAQQRLTSGRPGVELSQAALNALKNYDWPGNIRELKGALEFAMIASKSPVIDAQDLPPELQRRGAAGRAGAPAATPTPAAPALPSGADERERILQALEMVEGNRVRAARVLGVSRATLYRRLGELGIPAKKGDGD